MSRRWSIVEDVSEVSIATDTQYLVAHHTVRSVAPHDDVFLRDRLPEAWPASAGLELGFGIEKHRVAADAVIQPVRVIVKVLAGARIFRVGLASDFELLFRKLLLPLRDGLFDFIYVHNARAHAHRVELDDAHHLLTRSCRERSFKKEGGRNPTCQELQEAPPWTLCRMKR